MSRAWLRKLKAGDKPKMILRDNLKVSYLISSINELLFFHHDSICCFLHIIVIIIMYMHILLRYHTHNCWTTQLFGCWQFKLQISIFLVQLLTVNASEVICLFKYMHITSRHSIWNSLSRLVICPRYVRAALLFYLANFKNTIVYPLSI